jgi:catechol 2,3-dioxygenase-like lactoylglutathione lyase family enzyme
MIVAAARAHIPAALLRDVGGWWHRVRMTTTTRVLSVTIPVPDQDEALTYYRDVLGCEVRYDGEPWPGARMIEVVPPGSSVGIVLLPPDSELPVGLRLGTTDAQAAFDRVRAAGSALHNDAPISLDGGSPMFFFDDPFGNGLVYIQEE